MKMPLKNSLILLAAATIWGTAFVAQSAGMDYMGPLTFNGLRYFLGAAVLSPFLIMKKFLNAETFRYLFIGVCTTLVNLAVFTVLCKFVHMNVNLANFISIVTAILFAYVTNKLYVFRSHCASFGELAAEFVKFCGARVATMVIELGGVFLIYNILGFDEMIAKCCTQVFVVIGNYFISKFFVFRGTEESPGRKDPQV